MTYILYKHKTKLNSWAVKPKCLDNYYAVYSVFTLEDGSVKYVPLVLKK